MILIFHFRELQDKKADLAVIDLSMTSSRQKAVDFTMPYMTTGEKKEDIFS